MRRTWSVFVLATVLAAPLAGARDYTQDWKFFTIWQPEIVFGPNQQPDFHWRRIRGVATGPIRPDLKAKFQINFNYDTRAFTLLDAFLDYTPVKSPVRLNFQGGMLYPAYAAEAQTFANTVNWAYMITSPLLFLRTAGIQGTVGFLDRYAVTGGVFNGPQNFDDTNEVPLWLASFTTVQPWFDARAWYYTGKDGTPGAESPTDLIGAEITDARSGRFSANGAYIFGHRFGRKMAGGFAEVIYRFDKNDWLVAKFDAADLNRARPFSSRQRYILSYNRRLADCLTSKWDVEFDQALGEVRGLAQGDIRF